MVVFGVYGCQSSKNTVDESMRKWVELFAAADKYDAQGFHVVIAGDMNAAIGASIPNNCPSYNNNGKNIIKILKNNPQWRIVNGLNKKTDNRTHVDRSHKSSKRCLDYFITNSIDKHFRMTVDNDYSFTPYRTSLENLEMKKEVSGGRIYSDHKAIMTSFRVNDKRKNVKLKDFVIRDQEGWSNLYLLTEEAADDLLEQMEKGKRPADLFRRAE